jgi:ABC-type polar amino acid transport system ATPase subunit
VSGAAIRVERLTHRHRGAPRPTLADVSFAVPAGAIAAIVGESGTGKTTLLRCLAGLDVAESGTITVGERSVVGARGAASGQGTAPSSRDGAAVGSRGAAATLRGHVGLVFQSFELFPHLSVLENCVLAPIRVRGIARATAEATARALLAQLGLADKLAEHPARLSGGQCQRVAIARALAMAPACLLYDEPTSALDPARRSELVDVLAQVRAGGMTQIVVTHDGALVDAVADLVFRLDAGRLTPR